ncbi:hypothetical protein [Comamonas odontotermitis]|uniref:hypothetical protein n=1 Tax=Comamonas odontotermitis TaxID=379895 RepID=UPI001CC81588|nr:hypothetical protein [Comamonas odontotermitis]UBB18387.1 hypothetical protein LAD35_07045 [Comamonas odontotermitis]
MADAASPQATAKFRKKAFLFMGRQWMGEESTEKSVQIALFIAHFIRFENAGLHALDIY